MSSKSNIDWGEVRPYWFREATEKELGEFVRAMDNGEIPEGERLQELKAAFEKECNRRSGEYYERLNDGEWI